MALASLIEIIGMRLGLTLSCWNATGIDPVLLDPLKLSPVMGRHDVNVTGRRLGRLQLTVWRHDNDGILFPIGYL